jgi:hypothetical protein
MTTPPSAASTTSTLSTEDNSVIHSNLDDNTQAGDYTDNQDNEQFYSLSPSSDQMVAAQASSDSNRYSSEQDEQSTESPSLIASNQTRYLLCEFFERSDKIFLCSSVFINRLCRLKPAATFLFHMESIGAIMLVLHLTVGFPSHVMMRQQLSHVNMSRVRNKHRRINQRFSNVDRVGWSYIRII